MKKLLLTLVMLMVIPLGFSQSKSEKKALKKEKELKEYESSKTLVESRIYEFVADWANTMKGRRISLTTNPNYIKINQSKADIFLPYFGVVHSPTAALKGEGGINFKGEIENYKVNWDDKKQKGVIKFNASATSERLDFIITTFKNDNTSISVNSNIQEGISYDGKINASKKEE